MLRPIARWLAPSLVACSLAVTIAGVVEAWLAGDAPLATLASAGFAAALAAPPLLLGSLAVRGLWAAWRPARLAAALTEDGGGAPRLAAWLVFLAAAAAALGLGAGAGVRLSARLTTFKVDVTALLAAGAAIGSAAALAAVSRPCVDALAAVLRRLDARFAAWRGRPLLTARRVVVAAASSVASVAALAWTLAIAPGLGPLDLGILLHPALALALTPTLHLAWRAARPRLAALALAAPAAAAAVGLAAGTLWVKAARPELVLALWSEPTVGGEAIETLLDVEELRSRASLAAFAPTPLPDAPPRSVVLITVDTLRWDRTPLAGGPAEMPALARLGAGGAVFERTFASSNVTRRSIPAIMLGAAPPRIRGRVVGWALKLDPRHVPLGERLRAAGYRTAGFFCCASFWDRSRRTGYSRGIDRLTLDKDGEVLAEDAARWLTEALGPGAAPDAPPVFAWLHFLEPHGWMKRKDVHGGGKDTRRARYDRALAEVDRHLGVVLAALEALPPERRPLVVLTSDHGEGLGDHGATYHSSDLYDSQLRVPLVIAGPSVQARRIRETVSSVDVAPTVLELAGFAPPGMPAMDGRSLADLARGQRPPALEGGEAYAVMMRDRSSTREARAIVRGRWKLIVAPGELELYDLVADPGERTDRAAQHPELVGELSALLEARRAVDRVPAFQP